jgi:hypothetical protein
MMGVSDQGKFDEKLRAFLTALAILKLRAFLTALDRHPAQEQPG